ncbi:MAG: DNA translocase FtsK 4TM domain-containing protein [Deltaproteobacteria bacterium]|nr:DNA translocase FtsK 4TM domain-containing protein [Deltaproteobacteria bacterium]
MAKNGVSLKTKNEDGIPSVGLEITGIALLAVALYAAVSLLSYSEAYGTSWGGFVGIYLSWALLKAIGYTAYIFPFILAFISFGFLLRRIFAFRLAVPVSFAFFILSASTLLSQMLDKNLFTGGPSGSKAGGLAGAFLSRYFTDILGYTGSVIILIAIVLITILIATGISVVRIAVWASPYAAAVLGRVFNGDKAEAGVEDEAETGEDTAADEPPAQKPQTIKTAPVIHHSREQGEQGKKKEPEEKERLAFSNPPGSFQLPPLSLLEEPPSKQDCVDSKTLLENSKVLEKTLLDFGIEGRVLEVRPGPIVTMYEFEPAPGVKVGRIVNLSDDLALSMKAVSIRIIAPIPGKAVVGIEIPNAKKDLICLREMLESQLFSKNRSRLTLALGKDISGAPYVADLSRMPHLLVAGATGSGKSVSVNAMVLSILFKATPEDVRFLMIDPKMLELTGYEGIPHLLAPVITDPKRAAGALKSVVTEMGKRYKSMAEKGAKNIEKYNQIISEEDSGNGDEAKKLPYIVVIIDELADLMMTSGKDVEECLVRLSQMARASGIHIIIATQRPSVDVVTGLIKTNFPARMAFQLPSKTDSRTVLDAAGAETLLGAGDMLYLPPGTSKLQRVHGVYVSEAETKRVTEFWKKQGTPVYDNVITAEPQEGGDDDTDDLGAEFMQRYKEAVDVARELEMISTSYIQRRFRIGYNTAARIIEKMESEGIVGPAQGSRPREVLRRG